MPNLTDISLPHVMSSSSTPQALLHDSPLLTLDGGLGTTLTNPPYNVTFTSTTTPTWSSHLLIADPDKLLAAQTAFVGAGARVLLTATYQASFEGFASTPTLLKGEHGGVDEGDARACMVGAVKIAREAFSVGGVDEGIVALSLGAYGACLVPSAEYSGDYGAGVGEVELEKWHRRRLQAFGEAWNEVDVVAFETLPRVDEVKAVRKVMRGVDRPFWISCVFPGDKSAEGRYSLPDGTGLQDLVAALLGGDEAKPWGIGINCTKIWKVRDLLNDLENTIEAGGYEAPRLLLYPDGAGDLVYDTTKQEWLPMEGSDKEARKKWEEEMADIVSEVQGRGRWKSVVAGGCCMTGPEHIKALSERLAKL